MAEEKEEPQVSSGSWWDSLLSTAKTKSVEVFEFMKKDFDEFSSVVKTEAASIANHTASAVKETLQLEDERSTANTVKRSVSSFFGTVKEALSPSPSSDLDEAIQIRDGSPVSLSRLQTKIYSLSKEDSTYLDEIPSNEKKQFEAWLSVSEELITNIDRLTAILASNQILQEKYTALVPNKVEHSKFWERFLFRKALLEDREAELQRRLEREKIQADSVLSQGDKLGNNLDLTEEEQMKILADYEEEQKKKKDSNTPSPKSSSSNLDNQSDGKDHLKVKEKNGLVIVSNVSSQTSTSSSKASTDGDWEKDFDLEDNEIEVK